MVMFESRVNVLGVHKCIGMYIMYCNIERNIMKNQSGFPRFGLQKKNLCIFSVLAIVYVCFLRICLQVISVQG